METHFFVTIEIKFVNGGVVSILDSLDQELVDPEGPRRRCPVKAEGEIMKYIEWSGVRNTMA